MLQASKAESELQGGDPASSADSQTEGVEFLETTDTSGDNSGTCGDIDDEATQVQPRPLRRSARISVPPARYGWDDHVSFALVTEPGDSVCYRDAIEAEDHDKWVTAMEEEMEFLKRN